ncbi:MAG: GSCFA domain-containing protein, partial [Chlorobi bacterium]|nr:GSCFA domain-containing protein [Chlorobiota bacterium]
NILLTVSPVRHWKNGAIENQKSKAILLLAVHEVVSEENSIYYFPSYEIMIDELRDYRFYDVDLVHPNKLGVEYIWEKFSDNYFAESTIEAMKKAEKIALAMGHKTRNPKSERHKAFIES